MSDEQPQTVTDAPQPWKGAPTLQPLLVPIDDVEPDPKNARRHPDPNLEGIAASLSKFGQLKPIVVKGKRILAGNGTWTVLKALNWTHVAIARVPDEMTDEEAVAFAIADNKTSDLSEWDFQELAELLREMPPDLRDFTGFRDFEIEPLIAAEWKPPPGSTDGDGGGSTVNEKFMATPEQATVIRRALQVIRDQEGMSDWTEGRCLELICADFLSGAPSTDATADTEA
jgi:hypothetical protein